MDIFHTVFFKFFTTIYPFVHNHLISYLVIFFVFAFLGKKLWSYILTSNKTKTVSSKVVKMGVVFCEGFIILFLAWFILVHFQSFQYL